MRLYLDTNVFGNFLEGSQSDGRRVGESKARGLIEIALSVLNLEEAMAAEPRNPATGPFWVIIRLTAVLPYFGLAQ